MSYSYTCTAYMSPLRIGLSIDMLSSDTSLFYFNGKPLLSTTGFQLFGAAPGASTKRHRENFASTAPHRKSFGKFGTLLYKTIYTVLTLTRFFLKELS
jgi:hypothetical protein